MLYVFQQAFYAFFSTVGFTVLFNAPKNCITKASFCGMCGWLIKMTANNYLNSIIGATFLGAATVGIIGEIFAKKFKKPATVFIIPGIIPLVPGAGMYYTMLNFINNDFYETIKIGSDTIFTAIAIAIAVIVSSSIAKPILRIGMSTEKINKR